MKHLEEEQHIKFVELEMRFQHVFIISIVSFLELIAFFIIHNIIFAGLSLCPTLRPCRVSKVPISHRLLFRHLVFTTNLKLFFLYIITGHITVGGSICMEMLTNSGWTPTNGIYMMMLTLFI